MFKNREQHNLYCSSNQLTTLDVSTLTYLVYLLCYENQLTTLDLTGLAYLSNLNCAYNQLTSLFIKGTLITGFNSATSYLGIGFNPNLAYICTNESNFGNIQAMLDSLGLTNCVVNSYCSFTPSGNYNTISGNVKYDSNNNGCDIADLPQPNIRININDGSNTGANFTNNTGNYSFFTQAGNFDIGLDVENPTFFNLSPTSATIPFANNNNNTATQDFCISANGVHNDLEVVVSPVTPARPGFDAVYNIVYKNKGNQTLSGDVSFTYDDAVLDFVSATIVPNSQSVGVANWSYTNLLPFENRSINVTLNVNSSTETPVVNVGDVLNFSTNITPIIADEIPADNSFSYNQTVVGSFDPNDITCLEGANVSPSTIGDYLHYAINFENTGTFPAENIVVKTTIDPTKFDINSLQLLNTSNAVDARITGNVIEFIFKNIHLPTGGHGHILLKIKSNIALISGDSVSKRADIFFDYNAPIDTGFANTTFQSLSNTVFVNDNSVSIYPNPTSSKINVNANSNIKSVELYDVQGRVLETVLETSNKSVLDISDKANGIYFLKITTEKGSKIEKEVKE